MNATRMVRRAGAMRVARPAFAMVGVLLRMVTAGAAFGVALVAVARGGGAQVPAVAPRPITVDEFTRRVAAYHPTVRQARLVVDQAREEQRVARGSFDPTLSASWDKKTFGTVEYYDYVTAALTVPTPLGVDVKIGYERAGGRYASPDRRTPDDGLVTAGLSIPLGQRIITDERRTGIAVARSLRDAADADRDAAVNRAMLQAIRDYARWYEAERRAVVAREGVTLAEFRLAAVRRRVANGEAAPLDTIESLLEVNRRRVLVAETEQTGYAARLAVEAQLWDVRGLPDSLPSNAVPSAELRGLPEPNSATIAQWAAAAEREHPDVKRAEARVDQAAAQRRLLTQQLLPYVAAELSALGAAGGPVAAGVSPTDDLKVGLTARSPLFFLRERGRATGADLRVEQQRVERDRARREVAVVVRTAANDVRTVARALDAQRAVVDQTRLMLRGEQRRFDTGESTLFLVNARERAVLDEALRLAGLEARAFGARAELSAAVGWWVGPDAGGR